MRDEGRRMRDETGQVRGFRRDGFLLLRGFYSQEEVAEIRGAFMNVSLDGPVPGLSEIKESYSADDPLARWPRMMQPHRHSELPVGPIAMRRMLDSRIETVLRTLFGEEPVAAQSMFYFKPPGARGQDLHQDNFYLRVKPGTCIAAWVAVDPAVRENGGLVVVPGSNHGEVFCPERADSAVSFTTEYVKPPAGLS